jgi:hypothetical protein
MAELRNDSGALRLALALVAREGGGQRILATVAVESLDQRDREWWPLVRLPPLHLEAASLQRLAADVAGLLRAVHDGFAWGSAADGGFGLQMGAVAGGAQLEVGLDLGPFLADAAGAPLRSGADLALFRWHVLQPDLVRFADSLARELEALPR